MLGISQQRSWTLVPKVAFDSMPKIRRLLFDTLVQAKDYQTTREIALAIRYPTKTVHRALEDLAVHRVVMRTTQKGKKGDVWTCTPETMHLYADTPETLNFTDFD